MTQRKRLAQLEARLAAERVVVVTVPHGSTAEEVAAANGFTVLPSDMVVAISKPEGCAGGAIRVCP